MQTATNKTIHWTVTPLYRVSRIFLLWPYKYDDNYVIKPLTNTNKAIAHVLNATILLYICWSIYGRLDQVYQRKLTITTITDISFGIPLFLLSLISIFLSNTKIHHRLSTTFYEQLNAIDLQSLHLSTNKHTKVRQRILTEILIFYIVNITAQAIDCSLFISMMGITNAGYYMGTYIVHNLMIAVFLQITIEAKLLRQWFSAFNKKLLSFNLSSTTVKETEISDTDNQICLAEKAANIRHLCFIQVKLFNLVEIMSSRRGLQILVLICCMISVILNALFYGFITGFGEKYNRNSGTLEVVIAANQMFVALMHFILIIILAGQCSSISIEARRSRDVANEMLLDVSMENESNSIKMYRRQLKILLQQAHYRNSKVSAAGFFAVDYSVVIAVMGAVASYFIILLQFRGSSHQDCNQIVFNSTVEPIKQIN